MPLSFPTSLEDVEVFGAIKGYLVDMVGNGGIENYCVGIFGNKGIRGLGAKLPI